MNETALPAQQSAPRLLPGPWAPCGGGYGGGGLWPDLALLPSASGLLWPGVLSPGATLTHLYAVAVSGPPCGGEGPWPWGGVAPGPPRCPGAFQVVPHAPEAQQQLFPVPGGPRVTVQVEEEREELVRQARPSPPPAGPLVTTHTCTPGWEIS